MSGNLGASFGARLEDAELRRLESEIKRNDAQRLKVELEAAELEKRLHKRWYHGRYLFEALIAGVVLAGLLAA